MSAHTVVNESSSVGELAAAGRGLADGSLEVTLAGVVRIRPANGRLICEPLDPGTAHRCAVEVEVLVENARRALEASRLRAWLPALPLEWRLPGVSD